MYLCICEAIKEEKVRKLLFEGNSVKEIIEKTGMGLRPNCNACLKSLKQYSKGENKWKRS
jgi:bacterioferritin-associated ferredoxin